MNNLLPCICIVCCLCLIPGCNRGVIAQANQAPEIHTEFDLDNGLKVMLMPLPSATKNTLVVLYDVGNRNDPAGKSGIAHMSEHLYVTAATENTRSRNVQQYMADYPDGWNAQTGDDYTVIATVFAADRIEDEISDAADRMRKLKIEQSDFDREIPRIDIELQNMYQGFPPLAVSNHGRHYTDPLPNDGRRGGKIDELTTVTVAEIQDWLDQYYKPGNATLILAGAFDEDATRKLIEEKFGDIDRGNQLAAVSAVTPSEKRIHQVELKAVSAEPKTRVGFTFQAPGPDDPLYAAFLVHTTRMQMSAMNKARGTKPQGMPDIPYMFRPLDEPAFFYVSSNVNEGESSDEALKRLETMLHDDLGTALKKHHVISTSSQMAMFLGTRQIPAKMMAMNTYGNAFALGRRHQMGIDSNKLAQQFEDLTDDQMKQAHEKFFGESNRITVTGTPK